MEFGVWIQIWWHDWYKSGQKYVQVHFVGNYNNPDTGFHHMLVNRLLGASKVKWTTPDAYLVFSESDSFHILTLNFEGKKIIDILKTYCSTMNDKKIPRKLAYFRRRCKWCANRWYGTINCLNHVKKMKNYTKLMDFYSFCDDASLFSINCLRKWATLFSSC